MIALLLVSYFGYTTANSVSAVFLAPFLLLAMLALSAATAALMPLLFLLCLFVSIFVKLSLACRLTRLHTHGRTSPSHGGLADLSLCVFP